MKLIFSDEEQENLSELPPLPFRLYFALKRRVSLLTGLVGGLHGVSYQALSEDTYIAPQRGIAAVKASRWAIARAVEWLVKRGLVAHVGDARSNRDQRLLILRLPMQPLSQFAQKKAAPKPHLKPHVGPHRENPQKAARTPPRKAALHLEKDIATSAANNGGDSFKSGAVEKLEWQSTYPQDYTQPDRRSILKVAREHHLGANTVQLLLDELVNRERKGAIQNRPGFFVHLVKQYHRGTFFGKGAQTERQHGSPLSQEEAALVHTEGHE